MSPALAGGFFTAEPPEKPSQEDILCHLPTNTVLCLHSCLAYTICVIFLPYYQKFQYDVEMKW